MKRYLKPITNVFSVEMNPLLTNSVGSVTGDVDDIDVSGNDFEGGNADSRRRHRDVWQDEEDEDELY